MEMLCPEPGFCITCVELLCSATWELVGEIYNVEVDTYKAISYQFEHVKLKHWLDHEQKIAGCWDVW